MEWEQYARNKCNLQLYISPYLIISLYLQLYLLFITSRQSQFQWFFISIHFIHSPLCRFASLVPNVG